MDHCKSNVSYKNKIIILTRQTFTVTQSHTGTSGSNIMVEIEVTKFNVSCIEFQKRWVFSADINN